MAYDVPPPEQCPEPGYYYHYKHDPNGPLNNYAYYIYGVGHHTEMTAVLKMRSCRCTGLYMRPPMPTVTAGCSCDRLGFVCDVAEADEVHAIETIWGPQCFTRRLGKALHPARAARRSAEHPSHDWVQRTAGPRDAAASGAR
jgi:hypothetical protein